MRTRLRFPGGLFAGLAVVVVSAAGAQNLLVNGDFHDDALSWELSLGSQLDWTGAPEEADCSGSGAALVTAELASGLYQATIHQCVELGDLTSVHSRVRHRGNGDLVMQLVFLSSFDCTFGFLTNALLLQAQNPTQWQTASLGGAAPPSANAVLLSLNARDEDPHALLIDAAYLGERNPIHLDGFEGNQGGESEPCRWTTAP